MLDRLNKSKRFRNLTSVVGAVLMAAIFATAILTERSLSRLAESREVVTHALFVDKAIRDMMSQMLDAETGQRGYLLSGRAPYLQPYYTALAQMRQSRTALGSALSHEPSALEQLNVLDKAIAAKLQDLEHTVSLKSEGRSDEGVELILTDTANQTMNAVREALRSLETSQILRTNQQMAEDAREIRNNYLILAISVLVNLLLLAGLVQRFRNAVTQGDADQHVMDERNVELSRLLAAAATRNEQVQCLSGLNRFLQSCEDMDEAVGLLKQHLPSLMRSANGSLYLMVAEQNHFSQSFTWGSKTYVASFAPGACWAARLGQPFRQPFQTGSSSCAHLRSGQPDAAYNNVQCLPLMAHAEWLGMVVLETELVSEQPENLEIEGSRRFAIEQVGLSIGNLKLRESLRQAAIRDVLTGLYNRRFFDESSQREVIRALRLQGQDNYAGLALMMIDIDHFKRFNDQYGHDVGDQVLREVAQVLQNQTRGSDVAARYGGEEFTIVLADITKELALGRAQRVREAVEKLVLRPSGKDVGSITISIGLAQFPANGSTVEDLLSAADKALYEAKSAGRNRVVVATDI